MSNIRKFYIAGPMAGIKDFNYPLFDAVAERLRSWGHTVYCPTEQFNDATPERREARPYWLYMEASLHMLLKCDAIVMLPGWEESPGATFELDVANKLGYSVSFYQPTGQIEIVEVTIGARHRHRLQR